MQQYILTRSQTPSQDTFAVITNLWDYKLAFLCPICGLLWYTPEHTSSRITGDTRPNKLHIHCAREGGCGNHYMVVFEWGDI